jgi:hypothetical protein
MLSSVRDMVPDLAVWALILPSTLAAILPQYDPFYNAPDGYQNKTPGTILRTRKVATSYLGLVSAPVQAWQLLYRTTAINGTAIAAATTVFKPLISRPDSFVSFQTAYDGSAVTGLCDPSYTYQLLAPQLDLISCRTALAPGLSPRRLHCTISRLGRTRCGLWSWPSCRYGCS